MIDDVRQRVFREVMDGNDIVDVARRWQETPQRIREVVYTQAREHGLFSGKLPTIARLRQRWVTGTGESLIDNLEMPDE